RPSGRLGAARGTRRGAVSDRESASGWSELESGAHTAAGGRRGECASTAEGDNFVKFTRDKVPRVALGVASDPWYKAPRLGIPYINGAEFRVGDDDTIVKDWVALGALEAIFLPWTPWDGTSTPATLAASLPTAQAPGASGGETGRLLRAPFSQRAVRTHYADFIEHGEEAYMRSHFGDARADMSRSVDDMLTMMVQVLGGSGALAESTEQIEQQLRDIGFGDLADTFAPQR
ncbi:hypothetical protein TRAPUB_7997, partial [Trametes pubescens]